MEVWVMLVVEYESSLSEVVESVITWNNRLQVWDWSDCWFSFS